MKPFKTICNDSETEIIIQKSRFIGRCIRVDDEAKVKERLCEIKKNHWDASHNCFGYSLGPDGSIARFSDDGEPSGTAGLPIMECIKAKEIKNALVVVTRYFGGVLLGAGGLIRAYTKAATEAIELSTPVWMLPCTQVSVSLPYKLHGSVEPLASVYGSIVAQNFSQIVQMKVLVPTAKIEAFLKAVTEKTGGKARVELLNEQYGMFDTIK